LELDERDAKSINRAKVACLNLQVRGELEFVKTNFGFIPDVIKMFKSRYRSLEESIQRLDTAVGILENLGDVFSRHSFDFANTKHVIVYCNANQEQNGILAIEDLTE
jgi:DNA polymerase II small subunit/DNA polymerase delta subunit B